MIHTSRFFLVNQNTTTLNVLLLKIVNARFSSFCFSETHELFGALFRTEFEIAFYPNCFFYRYAMHKYCVNKFDCFLQYQFAHKCHMNAVGHSCVEIIIKY